MTAKERAKLTEYFGWTPFVNETVDEFIVRMEDVAGSNFKERNKLKTFREQNAAGKFFPPEAAATPSGTISIDDAGTLVGSAYEQFKQQQGGQGVQQGWSPRKQMHMKQPPQLWARSQTLRI